MSKPIKNCPLMLCGGNYISSGCLGSGCAWWCSFAKECAVPLLAGMFADSEICNNIFDNIAEQNEAADET